MLLPLFVGVMCLVLILLFNTLCPPSFAIILIGERERAGCFTLIFFLISCANECSVALPHNAVGWSAVYENGFPDHTNLSLFIMKR